MRYITTLFVSIAFVLSSGAKGQGVGSVASGTVVDVQKKPIEGAEVLALDSVNAVRATTLTANDGSFTLTGLATHTQYSFTVRKIGFSVGTLQLTTPPGADTLWFDVQLQGSAQALRIVQVTSTANPAYRVDSAEIAKHGVIDALDVVLKLRPRMLGDGYKECRPDTSHIGSPIPPPFPSFGGRKKASPSSAQAINDRRVQFDTSLAMHYGAVLLPRMSNPADTLGKVPTQLYINGVLHSEWGMKNILAHIPPEDVAEMHYVDCWDTTVPVMLRNALFVNLKPGKSY